MPELGAVIAEFLGQFDDGARSRAELRELRGALAHVGYELGTVDIEAVRPRHVQALVEELRAEGLPDSRVDAVVEALRLVYAFAVGRGVVRTSPLVGMAPPAAETRTPTDAMLELGEHVVTWVVRVIVIAFLVVAVGLAIALA